MEIELLHALNEIRTLLLSSHTLEHYELPFVLDEIETVVNEASKAVAFKAEGA